MGIIDPSIIMPELKLEYINNDGDKILRVISNPLDPVLIYLLKEGKIRMQVWIEREQRKGCGDVTKRSWVHSIDKTATAPARLFVNGEYNYGGGLGWGWGTQEKLPPYSTTNGFAPTEFEISSSDLLGQIIDLRIKIIDIFSNILKCKYYAVTNDLISEIALLGRNKSSIQPIRVRLMVNHQKKAYRSLPSNPLILGIHRIADAKFNENEVSRHVKVSYYR